VDEFLSFPVVAGCCVITHPAPNSPVGRASARLRELPFWLWRVLGVFVPGAELPQNSRQLERAAQVTYEAQLYAPLTGSITGRNAMHGVMKPCWDKRGTTTFLYTPAEKIARQGRKGRKKDKGKDKKCKRGRTKVYVPLTAFLRPENLTGGGFMLTAAGRIPNSIWQHCLMVHTGPAS
jgi:hypothetical protein